MQPGQSFCQLCTGAISERADSAVAARTGHLYCADRRGNCRDMALSPGSKHYQSGGRSDYCEHLADDACRRALDSTKASRTHFVWQLVRDRKSTRLNSSHPSISYAVFCLKKKKNKQN